MIDKILVRVEPCYSEVIQLKFISCLTLLMHSFVFNQGFITCVRACGPTHTITYSANDDKEFFISRDLLSDEMTVLNGRELETAF